MGYGVIGAFVAIVAVAVFLLSIKLLANKRWLMGFLRGFAGFTALVTALLLCFSALDIFTFRSLVSDQSVMTVSFRRTSPHHFEVEIQESSGNVIASAIEGDQWQLDARMFHWAPLFKAVGFRVGYQLDALKGKYNDAVLQGNTQNEGQRLREPSGLVDVWLFINTYGVVPGVSAVVNTPGWVPAIDGAIFDVQLSGAELVAKPVNDAARNVNPASVVEEEAVLLEEINLEPENGTAPVSVKPSVDTATPPAGKAAP